LSTGGPEHLYGTPPVEKGMLIGVDAWSGLWHQYVLFFTFVLFIREGEFSKIEEKRFVLGNRLLYQAIKILGQFYRIVNPFNQL
jgi:hypothetical protein